MEGNGNNGNQILENLSGFNEALPLWKGMELARWVSWKGLPLASIGASLSWGPRFLAAGWGSDGG